MLVSRGWTVRREKVHKSTSHKAQGRSKRKKEENRIQKTGDRGAENMRVDKKTELGDNQFSISIIMVFRRLKWRRNYFV